MLDVHVPRCLHSGPQGAWRAVLSDEAVREKVARVRHDAGPALAHLSLLRTLDIVIWMRERG